MWKNTCAPHTNMIIVMPSGMNVQSSSSASEPWIASPTSLSFFRWNFTANTTTRSAIRIVKNAETARRKKYSASIVAACSEACCGKKGKFVNTSGSVRDLRRMVYSAACRPAPLPAKAHEDERQHTRDRADEADAHCEQRCRAVLPRRRIVVVAEQQHRIDDAAQLVVR